MTEIESGGAQDWRVEQAAASKASVGHLPSLGMAEEIRELGRIAFALQLVMSRLAGLDGRDWEIRALLRRYRAAHDAYCAQDGGPSQCDCLECRETRAWLARRP